MGGRRGGGGGGCRKKGRETEREARLFMHVCMQGLIKTNREREKGGGRGRERERGSRVFMRVCLHAEADITLDCERMWFKDGGRERRVD